jgi:hypothetical protein
MNNKATKKADSSDSLIGYALAEAGLPQELVEAATRDYQRYNKAEPYSLPILTLSDLKGLDLSEPYRRLGKAVKNGLDVIRYIRYLGDKQDIAETYEQTKDWYEVLSTKVYSDSEGTSEAFIDCIQEIYQTQVIDVPHLQELTGITQLDSWDTKADKYVEPATEQEGRQNAINQLQATIIEARSSRYARAMNGAIKGGAKYKDLLEIKPHSYGLPESWMLYGTNEYNQHKVIIIAIDEEYMLGEVASLMLVPSPRAVAEDLEAPYSLIMDSYKWGRGI